MLTCITFDLDDTLWDNRPVMAQAERALADWLAEHQPTVAAAWSVEALHGHRQRILAEAPEIGHDLSLVRRLAMQAFAREIGVADDWVAPALERFYEQRHRVAPFPGVPALLTRLRGDFRVGAITNGNADLRRIGLAHCFDFIVYAAQAGAAKPDPEIFRLALTRLGATPNEVLHVGDDPRRDVTGALSVGMQAAWINPADQPWPEDDRPRPHVILSSVLDLEAWLSERASQPSHRSRSSV